MQLSATSATYGGSQTQRVLASLLQQASGSTGQQQPGKTGQSAAPPMGPPPGPPPGGGAKQFASDTLSSLLSTQEASGKDDLANRLIQDGDTDGDGLLSLGEIQTAMGSEASDQLTAAVSNLDTDGDGKLSAEELSAGLEANRPERRGPPPPSSADVASRLIDDVDSDRDGSLSLAEIKSKLGVDDDPDLTSGFGKLDTDGDSLLSTAELTAALDAFQAARGDSGWTARTTASA